MKSHTEYMTFNTDERREFVRITGDVHPGAERRARPGQHHRADLLVLAEPAECLGELDPEVDRESVSLLRALQGDDGDVLLAFQ